MSVYTIHELFMFVLANEKSFDFDVNRINKLSEQLHDEMFYLGGQIKMKPNDIISLETIEQVKQITREKEKKYGGPCNSIEAMSINRSKVDLELIENIVKQLFK